MRTKTLLFSFFLFLVNSVFAQDAHFSQFYNTPLLISPAYTGNADGNIRGFMNYRTQWASLAVPYKTFAASLEYAVRNKKKSYLGLGAFFLNDKVGDFELATNEFTFSVAAGHYLNEKNKIVVGIQTGICQKSIKSENFKWGNQYNGLAYDPSISASESFFLNKISYSNLSAGIAWDYDLNEGSGGIYSLKNYKLRTNLALGVYHVNRPNISFYKNMEDRLYQKYIVHASASRGIQNTNIFFLPSIIMLKQGSAKETIAGMQVRYILKQGTNYTGFTNGNAVSFGAYYRYKDALIVTTQIEIAQYSLGISYDINISPLSVSSYGRGGVEFTLKYVNPPPLRYNARGKLRKRSTARF